MTPLSGLLLGLAGFGGGAINAAAGGGTLIAFPALLAAGVPAVTANITSSVGLLSGPIGASWAYRAELRGQRQRAIAGGLMAILGASVGAILLLLTPGEGFRTFVPYLILAAVALLLAGPRVQAMLRARGRESHPDAPLSPATLAVIAVTTIYGGYFGAGLSVMLLAILGIALHDDLQRVNALKGVLGGLSAAASVVVFIIGGHVDWGYALVVAIGAYLGGTFGVKVARKLPPHVLRGAVALAGTTVAIILIVRR